MDKERKGRGSTFMTEKEKNKLKEIGKVCRDARMIYGVTQKVIADFLGYHRSAISNFERGLSNNAIILHYYITEFLL